jgi:hypothetical protein
VVSFPQVSPLKHCISLFPSPYALHAPPISFFSILSHEQYWVWISDIMAHLKLFEIVIKEKITRNWSEDFDSLPKSWEPILLPRLITSPSARQSMSRQQYTVQAMYCTCNVPLGAFE